MGGQTIITLFSFIEIVIIPTYSLYAIKMATPTYVAFYARLFISIKYLAQALLTKSWNTLNANLYKIHENN